MLLPGLGSRLVEVLERVADPTDAIALRNLYVGRVEAELRTHGPRSELAWMWRNSRKQRAVDPQSLWCLRVVTRFAKEMFNWFFRDDVYGLLRPEVRSVLSSGSVDASVFGAPPQLKDCIRYALDRDWYGYSDSRGRIASRQAVAALENRKVGGASYSADHVAVTMGGTMATASVVDLLLAQVPRRAPVLVAVPNYPPLVESIARLGDVELVPLPCGGGRTSLKPLIRALRPNTPLVMLQSVTNPTGTIVDEAELERLITSASPSTMILLDECHEYLGTFARSTARARGNVIRIISLSKSHAVPGMKIGWLVADPSVISAYYERASTSFGGPPSLFSLLVEITALMERWRMEGRTDVGRFQLRELESPCGLTTSSLSSAYQGYRGHCEERDAALIELREEAARRMQAAGCHVVASRASINIVVRPPRSLSDSYLLFRTALRSIGVAVYPGLLAFCFDEDWIRLTPTVAPEVASAALDRLAAFFSRHTPQ